MLQRLRERARALKCDVLSLWFACRDPRTPVLVKVLATLVVAYALSPIDLIPDFIPVLGYLDELILLPAAIWLLRRLLPPPVLEQARRQASDWLARRHPRPRSLLGAALIVTVWAVLLWVLWSWIARRAW